MRALTVALVVGSLVAMMAAGCGPKKEEAPQLQPAEPGMAPAVVPTPAMSPVMAEPLPPPPVSSMPPVARPKNMGKSATEAAPGAEAGQHYTVLKGDTLFSIAKKVYGDGKLWTKIADANKDKIHNKNRITVGMVLAIPPK